MALSSSILGRALGRVARYSVQSYASVFENVGKLKRPLFNNIESQVEKVQETAPHIDSAHPYTNYVHPDTIEAHSSAVPVNSILGGAYGRLARHSVQSYASVFENVGKLKRPMFNNIESQVKNVQETAPHDSAHPFTNYVHPYTIIDAHSPSVPVNRAVKKDKIKSTSVETPSETIARIRSNRKKSCTLRKINDMKKKSFYKIEEAKAKEQLSRIARKVFTGGSPQTAYNLERPNLWKQVKQMTEGKKKKSPSFVYRVI